MSCIDTMTLQCHDIQFHFTKACPEHYARARADTMSCTTCSNVIVRCTCMSRIIKAYVQIVDHDKMRSAEPAVQTPWPVGWLAGHPWPAAVRDIVRVQP